MSIFVDNSFYYGVSVAYAATATASLTMMGWMYALPGLATYRTLISCGQNMTLELGSTGLDPIARSVNYNWALTAASAPINTETWYHLAVSVRPTTTTNRYIRGYINGVLVTDLTDAATTWTAQTTVSIGNYTGGGNPLYGYARDCRYWNRVLPANEIVDEMNSRTPVHNAGLQVWMPLEDSWINERAKKRVVTDNSGGALIVSGYGTSVMIPNRRRRSTGIR